MSERKFRVLIIASHPVQYASPVFRTMANHPNLDILVAYCSMHGIEASMDSGFGVEVKWDIPLLDGYPWIQVANQSPKPGIGRFFGLINLPLWQQIRQSDFDSILIYTGYSYFTFWVVAAAAKLARVPLMFGTDAHELQPQGCSNWKAWLKKVLLPKIFSLADVVTIPSSAGERFILSLGIPKERIQLTPFVVDNDWWIQQSRSVDRVATRHQWKIPEDAHVILFCAKLHPRKCPKDILRAFAKAQIPNSYLIFAGDGIMRSELETEVEILKLERQTRFLGFVNQSQLPATYSSADLFVFTSQHEPFGVVVNEAMLCGCPVLVSDCIGARYDLVEHGETGFVYPCGDIEALAKLLKSTLADKESLQNISANAHRRMKSWSPSDNVEAVAQAIQRTTTTAS